jgi:hypothetical protein
MMVTRFFTLMAAMAPAIAGPASAQESHETAQLGVTATVVQPAEVTIYPAPVEGNVALVRNAASTEVVADGGTVHRIDDAVTVMPDIASGSVVITLIF